MSDEPFKIVPADQAPTGPCQATFVYDPPLEKWPLMPDQEHLYPGDFIKRDAAGRLVNVSLFSEATHTFVGADTEHAYVQSIPRDAGS